MTKIIALIMLALTCRAADVVLGIGGPTFPAAGNIRVASWGSSPWWHALPSGRVAVLLGDDAGDVADQWTDLSGNGNHVTLYGGATKTGDGIQFDGTDDYGVEQGRMVTNLTAFSVICVADVQRFSNYNFIYSRHDTDYNNRFQAVVALFPQFVEVAWYDSANSLFAASDNTTTETGNILLTQCWDGTNAYSRAGTVTASGAADFRPNAPDPITFAKFDAFYAQTAVKCFIVFDHCLTAGEYTTATNLINARYPGGIR